MTENKSYFVVVKMTHGKMKPEDGNCRLIALFYKGGCETPTYGSENIAKDVPQSEFVTVTGTSYVGRSPFGRNQPWRGAHGWSILWGSNQLQKIFWSVLYHRSNYIPTSDFWSVYESSPTETIHRTSQRKTLQIKTWKNHLITTCFRD